MFGCPEREHVGVTLSQFRLVDQLPGAARPAVFRVRFACACGDEHDGLLSHEALDWEPLGLGEGSFLDLMTSKVGALASELADLAARRIQLGDWPWSFFCYPEERPRPIFPSSFRVLAPGASDGFVGLAVRCPACESVSVNLVSRAHVDLPFHNDAEIGMVPHVFAADAAGMAERFEEELYSSTFDSRRLLLE